MPELKATVQIDAKNILPLDAEATIKLTGQRGRIIGVSHFIDRPSLALIEFVDGNGNVTEQWFSDRQIEF